MVWQPGVDIIGYLATFELYGNRQTVLTRIHMPKTTERPVRIRFYWRLGLQFGIQYKDLIGS